VSLTISIVLSFILTFINQFNHSLETAFLQNDPEQVAQLLPASSPVLITLPEPFQISDFFSREQAKLIMKRLFRQTSTLEFFIDQESQPVIDSRGAIIQARWSMVDRTDRRKYLFRLYIYVSPEEKNFRGKLLRLKIRELRAEKR